MRPVEKRVANFQIPRPLDPKLEYRFEHGLGTDVIVSIRGEDDRKNEKEPDYDLGDGYVIVYFKNHPEPRNYVVTVIG